MKTIYLKAATKAELITDIQKVIPEYAGEIEFGNGKIFGHYIGDLMVTPPIRSENLQVINPAVMAGFEHANLLVPYEFDESVFETNVAAPNNPKHKFA
jgi:hypothetical protein